MDVDILPETCRRVRLVKHGSDKPLGFYIRDGNSVRVTPQGLVKNQGIFISKLVAGGLAEGTGLLAQNDEVLEVNGIDVAGKTLDQVTDMMVACHVCVPLDREDADASVVAVELPLGRMVMLESDTKVVVIGKPEDAPEAVPALVAVAIMLPLLRG